MKKAKTMLVRGVVVSHQVLGQTVSLPHFCRKGLGSARVAKASDLKLIRIWIPNSLAGPVAVLSLVATAQTKALLRSWKRRQSVTSSLILDDPPSMVARCCGCAVASVGSVAVLGSVHSTWTENKAEQDRTK